MIKNYLITGDFHGEIAERLQLIEGYNPEETGIIILGDVGANFYLDASDCYRKNRASKLGYTLYCVRGNHEERPENIPTMTKVFDENLGNFIYQEEEFPLIKYLIDGYEYKFGEYNCLILGGAYSIDKEYRLARAAGGFSGWFPDEQLSAEEMAAIREQIKNKRYNFIFSHTCPISYQPTDLFLPFIEQSGVDKSMEIWMEEIKSEIIWGVWCFGHYHTDRIQAEKVEIFYYDYKNIKDVWEYWYDT